MAIALTELQEEKEPAQHTLTNTRWGQQGQSLSSCHVSMCWSPAPSASCSWAWRAAWPSEEDSFDCGKTNHIAGVRGTLGQRGVFRVFSGWLLNQSLGSFQNGNQVGSLISLLNRP